MHAPKDGTPHQNPDPWRQEAWVSRVRLEAGFGERCGEGRGQARPGALWGSREVGRIVEIWGSMVAKGMGMLACTNAF